MNMYYPDVRTLRICEPIVYRQGKMGAIGFTRIFGMSVLISRNPRRAQRTWLHYTYTKTPRTWYLWGRFCALFMGRLVKEKCGCIL